MVGIGYTIVGEQAGPKQLGEHADGMIAAHVVAQRRAYSGEEGQ